MTSCGAVERSLLDVVRGTASDAVRLEVEAHLERCASCREARATFGLIGALRAQPAPHLGASARRRIVASLVDRLAATGGTITGAPRASWRSGRGVLAGVALAAVGALAIVAGPRAWRFAFDGGSSPSSAASSAASAPTFVEGQTLDATEPGVVAFAGAGVAFGRGAALTFHPETRTLAVARGDVDVDVTEHRARHFRVTTPRFVVEVLGTHFVVTPTGVRTLRGHVRVLDLEGHELAVVDAGQSWSMPPAPVAPPAPVELPAAVAPPAAAAPAPPAVAPPAARPSPVDVADLVTRARAALAQGDAPRAATFVDRALAAGPAPTERPAVELLAADAMLVARRPEEAIAAYRDVARRHPRAPEGEAAAFAVGQLLLERGAEAEAGAALNDYLARYPHGRFVREARERLAQLHATE